MPARRPGWPMVMVVGQVPMEGGTDVILLTGNIVQVLLIEFISGPSI